MNFTFRFFLASFLLLFTGSLFSQVTVSGKCVDAFKEPIPDVEVVVTAVDGVSRVLLTNSYGSFQTEIPAGLARISYLYVEPSGDSVTTTQIVTIPDQRRFGLETVQFNVKVIRVVRVTSDKDLNGIEPLKKIDLNGIINTEKYLLYATPANSNNELTSNYNVRGGNYDENLVYVNGFLINRPFLTRSGQQEGMSFINTALVDKIYFSAGGFQAVYGDKLSSVLDIKYKRAQEFHASVMASLLGVEAHVEDAVTSRFRYLFGARYRANGYLLNSLPTKGNYNPVFWDAQFVTEYDITEKWKWSILGHFSSNTYQFAPQTQQTDFGTANEAYAFNIYFDGQEKSSFLTGTGGTSISYEGERYKSTTYVTAFKTDEREYFDIQGQYYINELETDPSKEEFGDSIAVLGIGTFLNHARNRLQAFIVSAYHDASYSFRDTANVLKWGFGVQQDQFTDVLSEWKMIDSAGYSLPQTGAQTVDLLETIKGNLSLNNTRAHAYVQHHVDWKGRKKDRTVTGWIEDSLGVKQQVTETIKNTRSRWELEAGVRALYTSFNEDMMITPRVSLSFIPIRYVYNEGRFRRRAMKFTFAAGTYYQPPFYREFRTFTGGLNPEVVSQKSLHLVASGDYTFYMWKREKPFKFSADAYYKYLWDVNSYEIENVRTRYYANNNARGYATGLDLNLNGEFVEGIPSFFKLGILSTKEDVLNDFYYNYYNAAGEKITGLSTDQQAVDSSIVHPGYIRRPTDQHLNMAIMFQDKMPGYERFGAQMGLIFGSRLPYGPPDYTRYKDTLTMKSYFRVDLGVSYDLLYKKEHIKDKWYGKLQDAVISLEVFNLLGINNVLSKQWVQDVSGKYYSIPNYLTQRRFNLKLVVRI